MMLRLLIVCSLILLIHSSIQAKDAGQSARFQLPISKIRALLQSTDNISELIEQLRKNGRGPAFAIETLALAYEKRYPKTVGKLREPAKSVLEDPVGHYIDWVEHLVFAEKLKWKTPAGEMPPEIRTYLEEKRDVSIAKLTQLLLAKDSNGRTFIGLQKPASKKAKSLKNALEEYLDLAAKMEKEYHSGKTDKDLSKLKSKLSKARDTFFETMKFTPFKKGSSTLLDWFEKEVHNTEWDGSNQDRLTLLEFLSEHFEEKLIKTIYDMTDLQEGLHELRRKERIPSILLGNLMGKAILDETSIRGFNDIKLDALVANSPYAKLTDLVNRLPVFFPRTTHLQFTQIIEKMGDAKDMGEAMYEWLFEALKITGYSDGSKSTPEALVESLVKTHERYVDPIPTGQKLYEAVRGSKLFLRTQEYLAEQMSWSKAECLIHLRAVREGRK